jgi:ligand-binding sensor domain-containing protein
MMARALVCILLALMLAAGRLTAENLFIHYLKSDGLVTDDNKSIAIDSAGVVWIGGRGIGATAIDGENIFQYTSANSGLTSSSIRNIFIDSKDRLWFCQGSDGVVLYDHTNWTRYSYSNGLIANSTFMAAETGNGSIYVATWLGMGLLTNGIWSSYNHASGLAEDWVNYVLVDRSNSVWLGYKTKGISQGNPLSGWNTPAWVSGSEVTEIRVIVEDLRNNIWCGTRNEGVARYDGSEWKVFTEADGLGLNSVWDMAVDSSGGIWCATFGGGLSHFDGTNWDTYTNLDAGYDKDSGWNWTFGVAVARDGSIWVTTGRTVSMLPKENIRVLGISCDFNGDGHINVVDVLALLLLQRRNPSDPRADRNGDGEVSTADALELLRDIQSGACK